MNTQKYGVGNCGLLMEVNRTMYGEKDTVSKGLIDKTKTHLNYNLCPHSQYTKKDILELQEKVRGKKFRKDGVFFGSTILTLPKDYTGNTEDFFKAAYKHLKTIYKLKDEDVVSAYVHLDETTPHMHFYFVPVFHDENKDTISWDKVVPRKVYQQQHTILKKAMEKELGVECNILNGETLGIDITQLSKENKILSMENMQLKEEIKTNQIYKQELKEQVGNLNKEVNQLKQEKSSLENALKQIRSVISSYMEKFQELKPKALKTHFKSIFHQRKLDVALKHCEEKEETIESFLKNNDLTSEIPVDDFGVFQRNVDKMEDLLSNDELELE